MRPTPKHFAPLALLLAATMAPQALTAQEAEAQQAEEMQPCTAVLTPAQITAGEAAVKITATLSEDLGDFETFEAPEGSGLIVVSPEDVPMEETSAEGEAVAEATDMAAEATDANTFVVWVNSLEANAGTFDVKLIGAGGSCAASIEVTPAG